MDAEDIILPQFSLQSPSLLFAPSFLRQGRDYFAVKDEDPRRGVAPDVMPLDPRLSGQLFAFLRQLIESMVQIEAQMRPD